MGTKRRVLAVIVVLLAVGTAFSADLKPVEKQAMMEFFGKNLLMSHPYLGNKLRFDASGALLGNSDEGPWTTSGILHVEEVELKEKLIRISGRREIIALRTEAGKLGLQPILLTKRMTVDLMPSGPITSLDDVKQTIGRVFREENIARKFNAYWHGKAKITGIDPKTGSLSMDGGEDGVYGYLEDRPVYFPSKTIVPPKMTHHEDVDYTRAAAAKRTHGHAFMLVVVNEKGFPELLHLVKDLGDDWISKRWQERHNSVFVRQ